MSEFKHISYAPIKEVKFNCVTCMAFMELAHDLDDFLLYNCPNNCTRFWVYKDAPKYIEQQKGELKSSELIVLDLVCSDCGEKGLTTVHPMYKDATEILKSYVCPDCTKKMEVSGLLCPQCRTPMETYVHRRGHSPFICPKCGRTIKV